MFQLCLNLSTPILHYCNFWLSGTYTLGTMVVDVCDRRATISGSDTLAGSVASMDYCVRLFQKFTKCTKAEAIAAATCRPAEILKCSDKKGRIALGYDADMILLDEELNVLKTWVGGNLVFNK